MLSKRTIGIFVTWSPAGVINEYINDAEVIHNSERKMVSSLDGIEVINIEGQEFEAFSTSGGLGTMCETFLGKVLLQCLKSYLKI
jgi:saccharopine dehydrogenase-like NADP-dependent oxidoreductase